MEELEDGEESCEMLTCGHDIAIAQSKCGELHKIKSVKIPAQMGWTLLALPDQHPSRRAIGSWWLLMEGNMATVRFAYISVGGHMGCMNCTQGY